MLNAKIDGRSLSDDSMAFEIEYPPKVKVIDQDVDSGIVNILNGFHTHQLADLDKANLMDRVDVKFMLPMSLLPFLLTQLKQHYSVLEINKNRISRYYNEYYDTENLDLYQDHHNGKLNRFKVRQRRYLDTDTKFLEVKFKNNRKRTIKSRMLCPTRVQADKNCHDFIQREMGIPFSRLLVSQLCGYRRIALANEVSAERVTLDFDLWYQLASGTKRVVPTGFFIAELKQFKRSKLSPFYQLMSQKNISPMAFSKYCIGCALLYDGGIKTNHFKPVLKRMEDFSLPIKILN